jgi:hypothetical protein
MVLEVMLTSETFQGRRIRVCIQKTLCGNKYIIQNTTKDSDFQILFTKTA